MIRAAISTSQIWCLISVSSGNFSQQYRSVKKIKDETTNGDVEVLYVRHVLG